MHTGVDAYRKHFDAVRSGLPSSRAAVMEALEFPLRRNEAWRFTSAQKLLAEIHEPTYGAFEDLPVGVTGLDQAPEAREHLGKVSRDDGFLGLNRIFHREIAVVHAHQDREITLNLRHRGLSVPRILVVAEAGVRVTLSVNHTLESGLAVPVIELLASDGASISVTHTVVGTGHFAGAIGVGMNPGSQVEVQSFILGGDIVRLEVDASVSARSRFDASGLVLGQGRQHSDHHLTIHHAGQGARSTQRFRNILEGRARAIFTGQVTVDRHVTGTDAQQTANTLLLSEGSSVVTRPWLEIHNDDVTAAHGATVGRLDPESLFYLRSRGIPVPEARRLLTRAFAGEVVATVPESLREGVAERVEQWLEGAS